MIKFFSSIEEFDPKTNQIKVKDANGLIYTVPVVFVGTVRVLPKNTPVVVVMQDYAKSDTDFPVDQKVRIDAVAIPIYNENRFAEDGEVTTNYKLISDVSGGKINSEIEVGKSVTLRTKYMGQQSLKITGTQTVLQDIKMTNPDISYGDFAEPQNFLLRFRPDFPYVLPEVLPTGNIFTKVGKISKAFLKLRST